MWTGVRRRRRTSTRTPYSIQSSSSQWPITLKTSGRHRVFLQPCVCAQLRRFGTTRVPKTCMTYCGAEHTVRNYRLICPLLPPRSIDAFLPKCLLLKQCRTHDIVSSLLATLQRLKRWIHVHTVGNTKGTRQKDWTTGWHMLILSLIHN